MYSNVGPSEESTRWLPSARTSGTTDLQLLYTKAWWLAPRRPLDGETGGPNSRPRPTRITHLHPARAQDLDVLLDLCVVADQRTAPGQGTAANVPGQACRSSSGRGMQPGCWRPIFKIGGWTLWVRRNESGSAAGDRAQYDAHVVQQSQHAGTHTAEAAAHSTEVHRRAASRVENVACARQGSEQGVRPRHCAFTSRDA